MRTRGKACRLLNGTAAAVTGAAGMRPYNFKETGAGSVEVEMYGQVVESRPTDWWTGEPAKGLYIVLQEFLDDLDGYKDRDEITFRINSVGGDLFAGMAIYNRIAELAGNTITVVDGLAASAASVILQGGKTRRAFKGSQVMVHGASVFLYGSYNRQELRKVESRIEGGNKSVLEAYAERTGRDRDFLRGLMDREEWMTGQEAVDNGFVDELVEAAGHAQLAMSADRRSVLSNGIWMAVGDFRSIPKGLPVMEAAAVPPGPPAAAGGARDRKEKEGTGGKDSMDMEELRKKHPELVQQMEQELRQQAEGREAAARQEAVQKERQRLKEIGEIENQIADRKLVDEAKFGEKPMTAQELAFEAMRRQQATGGQFLADLRADAGESGVGGVLPAPNAGTKSPEEQEMEDISNGAALIAAAWK